MESVAARDGDHWVINGEKCWTSGIHQEKHVLILARTSGQAGDGDGITPFLIRDLQQRVLEIPAEQLIKAQTLGANSWQIIVRVILPQVLPRLIDAVRLSLGAAWLFLIAAEAIASTDGLGYRIFLVRRYLAMDVILPYVIWIMLLAFFIDYGLRKISQWCFPWFHAASGGKA